MNYYEHHLGDWAAATSHLTWDEDAAYTRLLRVYYHTEKAIPEGQQYRLAKASSPAQRKAVDSVLAEFFTLEDGAYRQKRADAEIARYHDKQRKAKASADARWSSPKRNADAMRTHSETDANALRAQCEGNALQSPDTSNQSSSLRSEERKRSPAGSRLPTDWSIPDGWISVATEIGIPAGAVCVEAEKFRDHWLAKSGKDGRKSDWLATWRTWCRNANDWTYKPKPGGPHGTNQIVRLSAVDRVRAASAAAGFGPEPAGRVIDA